MMMGSGGGGGGGPNMSQMRQMERQQGLFSIFFNKNLNFIFDKN